MMIRIADTHYIAADAIAEIKISESVAGRCVVIKTKAQDEHIYQPMGHAEQWAEKALADLIKKIEVAL